MAETGIHTATWEMQNCDMTQSAVYPPSQFPTVLVHHQMQPVYDEMQAQHSARVHHYANGQGQLVRCRAPERAPLPRDMVPIAG